MKKLIIILILAALIGCKAEKIELKKDVIDLVELKVSCYPAGFALIYQVEQWHPLNDTINTEKWSVEYLGESEDLAFISVTAFDSNAIITLEIYYEGNLIDRVEKQGWYSSAYLETYLP